MLITDLLLNIFYTHNKLPREDMMQNSNEVNSSQDPMQTITDLVNNLDSGKLEHINYEELKKENDQEAYKNLLHDRVVVRDSSVKNEMMMQRELKASWTFSSMDISPSNTIQVEVAKEFVNSLSSFTREEQAPNILIMGQNGSGKSHLAGAIAHELIMRGKRVLFVNFNTYMYQLLDDRGSEYCRKVGEDMMNNSYDLLVLDDVITGGETFSDYRSGRLSSIIRARNIANVSTVLNINCPSVRELRIIVGDYCFGGILDMIPQVIKLQGSFRTAIDGYDPINDKAAPNEIRARKNIYQNEWKRSSAENISPNTNVGIPLSNTNTNNTNNISNSTSQEVNNKDTYSQENTMNNTFRPTIGNVTNSSFENDNFNDYEDAIYDGSYPGSGF